MVTGRTVRIYMADGSPFGIRQAEIFNRTIQALAVSRLRIVELNDQEWSEARGAGVYFLFGRSGSDRAQAYIGQAQNVIQRIANHIREKDFWTEAILFVSKDKNINREYLEARLIAQAEVAARYELDNGKGQSIPGLSRADRDAMEEIISDIRLMLGVLGHPILEPIEPKSGVVSNDSPPGLLNKEFTFSGAKFSASGRMVDEGFLILTDSIAAADETDSLSSGYRRLRATLVDQGVLVPTDDGRLKFTQDYLASSSSQAASMIAGGSRSGPQSWLSGSKTLKEIEAETLPSIPTE